MASAVLAAATSRNEPNWTQIGGAVVSSFMGKNPQMMSSSYENHNLVNPNPNFVNNNPNLFRGPRKQNHNHHQIQVLSHHHQNGEELTAASDDAASSFSRRLVPPPPSGEYLECGLSHLVSFAISKLSRSDLRVLRTQLMGELDQIRVLSDRIESGELLLQSRGIGAVKSSLKEKKVTGMKRAAPFSPVGKEAKRTASSSPPMMPVVVDDGPAIVGSGEVMKMCKQLLNKLTRNKYCWPFNKPVDVVGMQLHDYYDIVKNPMDLGTVKTKLNRDVYPSPDEFAADVRLTFNNAMLYNPEGQNVHIWAKDLMSKFEDMFAPIGKKFEVEKQQNRQHRLQVLQQQQQRLGGRKTPVQVQPRPSPPQVIPQPQPQPQLKPHLQPQRRVVDEEVKPEKKHMNVEKVENEEVLGGPVYELQGSSWSKIASSPVRPKKGSTSSSSKQQERQVESTPEPPPPQVADPGRTVARPITTPKLPKPKAKEPNKREMTMVEKHRLGAGLQSLPEEKMAHVVQIIRKRNGHLTQDGDEIELDIEAVDTETLWELDRFVTNFKKATSKMKRQALMPINNAAAPIETNMAAGVSERGSRKGGEIGEEDVDIGDEMPMSHFPPVEIEKDDDGQAAASGSSSRSSSSSSGSSSSSDSDSGSSTDSDSDVDDALSRDNGSKNFHNT